MPRHRLPSVLTAGLVFFVMFCASDVRAGLFDDDEARGQVQKLTKKLDEWVDTMTKTQFDLVTQVQTLREENAQLRGQVELLSFELESEKKRQQDFYIDLDTRLRRFEPQTAAQSQSSSGAGKGGGAPSEPHDYEMALNLFKNGKLKDAVSALESFSQRYPDSSLVPNARYWLGNAHYALRDCKKAIEVYKQFLVQWPRHAKSPDAMVSVAACQQELGDTKTSRETFEMVLKQYPSSAAAATAKQRLKK
ncbi:MAG: tol-pal system protein YbgF [Candidatus Accumulibacter sp.]|jgi:tol-pal system protein YbgF|nr:tol-pal system protein YbgF [Accumulibacter sp.]